jgi:SAM-dependent methyltransferase
MNICGICQNTSDNKNYVVREMMLGTREEFAYFKCARCGCLQIRTVPTDIAQYYPETYYSLQPQENKKTSFLKKFLKKQRLKYCLGEKSFTNKIITKIYKPPQYFKWFDGLDLTLDSKILDVGCGSGDLLLGMNKEGFTNLSGVDPFITKEIRHKNNVTIHKCDISDLQTKFDCIMMHHSFEHAEDPLVLLAKVKEALADKGCILIRIPLCESYAWRTYREHWVQLDAPRHFFLHTKKSMSILAETAGLRITNIVYDSNEFQFLGSEQYKQDIPLNASHSFTNSPEKNIFTREEIIQFKELAAKLNNEQDGDQACFYLRK